MKIFSLNSDSKKELIKNLIMFVVFISVSAVISFFMVSHSINTHAKPSCDGIASRIFAGGANKNIFSSSDVIADIAEEVSPSVVHINTESVQTIETPGIEFFGNDEFFKRFFGFSPFGDEIPQQPRQQLKRKAAGMGSGLIISSDGYILTNYHVVRNASKITVKLKEDREYEAKLVGKDKYSDLAVIKINERGLMPAKLGDSSKIRPGQWAIAVGSPAGLDNTVTLGIVSALSREIPQLSNVSFIQTDAAINPGNSGGPLLNINGEVIGINTAIIGSAQNIGFAIPINIAKNIVNQLKSGQVIGHPWIGVAMSPITKEIAISLGISANTKGVVVGKVMPDSPAEEAGLAEGDIIQRIDGKKYEDPKEIQASIRIRKIGDKINVQILRDGNILVKNVKISNWEEK